MGLDLKVYPDIIRNYFWTDLENGFPETRYLGLTKVKYPSEAD